MKRTIPLFIATMAGVVMIVAYFVPPAQSWKDDLAIWFEILAAFAFVLGAGNVRRRAAPGQRQCYDSDKLASSS